MRNLFEVGQPECATGDTASTTTVALVGDSNAAMWNPAFQQIAAQRHWRLETLAKAACPLLDLPIINPVLAPGVHRVRAVARSDHRPVTAPSTRGWSCSASAAVRCPYGSTSGFTPYDPAWIDSLTRLVQQLRGTGAQVLVLGPIPDPHIVGAGSACPATSMTRRPARRHGRPRSTNPASRLSPPPPQAGGGQYADLTELFCTADRCPVIVGNTLVYVDDCAPDRRILPAAGTGNGRAGRPRARPRLDTLRLSLRARSRPISQLA